MFLHHIRRKIAYKLMHASARDSLARAVQLPCPTRHCRQCLLSSFLILPEGGCLPFNFMRTFLFLIPSISVSISSGVGATSRLTTFLHCGAGPGLLSSSGGYSRGSGRGAKIGPSRLVCLRYQSLSHSLKPRPHILKHRSLLLQIVLLLLDP